MKVAVCLNRYENGSFEGKLRAVIVYDGDDDLLSLNEPFNTLPCEYHYDTKQIEICDEIFNFHSAINWYGNWCWDLLGMSTKEMVRLLILLKAKWGENCWDEASPEGEELWNEV
jgi:hypothetical protein